MTAFAQWVGSTWTGPTWLRLDWRPWRTPCTPSGIDLGDGRTLGAEDVLEGHFRRLSARPRTHKVEVQVNDNLIAKIMVLAPDLAPLTELAEEVADVVPPVHPAPEFRHHLHQALERTHRQHQAQRMLGTRRAPEPAKRARPALMATMLMAALLLIAWHWWNRRSTLLVFPTA